MSATGGNARVGWVVASRSVNVLMFFGLLGSALAQCLAPGWQPATGFRGVGGIGSKVNDLILWDRDGQGGEPPVMVAGGAFTIAGTTFASNIAVWNGSTWEALGTGTNGEIHKLIALPNGDLVAGGAFSKCGDLLVNRIARWDGKAWSSMAGGVLAKPPLTTSEVHGLAVLPNGDLVASGFFYTAGGVTVNSIARWNGSVWSAFGSGMTTTSLATTALLHDLIVMPNGDLVASGNFDTAGGTPAANIARWNGEKWLALGAGIPAFSGQSLVLAKGDLVVDGTQRWDGTTWSPIGGSGLGQRVNSVFKVIALPDGSLVAGGGFTKSATTPGPANFLALWNGTAWVPMGASPNNFILCLLQLPNGDIVAGGYFNEAGGMYVSGLARWDGANWHYFGSGIGGRAPEPRTDLNLVYATARLANGNIAVGGRFTGAGQVNASYIAGWTGQRWFPFGAGLNADVKALAVLANGDLIAGGSFTKSGDLPISGVARWDGQQWTAVGGGVTLGVGSPPDVRALAVMPNGDLVVTGTFAKAGNVSALGLARWSWLNQTWSALGGSGAGSLAAMPNGDLILGSTVAGTGSTGIARWDGAKWNGLGTGLNGAPRALLVLPNGDLVAGGGFGTAGGIVTGGVARWDGAKWSRFGATNAPDCNALAIRANGRLLVGGTIRPSDHTTNHMAEWDGTKWITLGTGSSVDRFPGEVHALTALTDGGFVMGGRFTSVNGQIAVHFAHFGCPFGPESIDGPTTLIGVGMGGKGPRFQIRGAANKTYDVEYSPDLRTWSTVQSGLTDGALFEDGEAARRVPLRGFYRAAGR